MTGSPVLKKTLNLGGFTTFVLCLNTEHLENMMHNFDEDIMNYVVTFEENKPIFAMETP